MRGSCRAVSLKLHVNGPDGASPRLPFSAARMKEQQTGEAGSVTRCSQFLRLLQTGKREGSGPVLFTVVEPCEGPDISLPIVSVQLCPEIVQCVLYGGTQQGEGRVPDFMAGLGLPGDKPAQKGVSHGAEQEGEETSGAGSLDPPKETFLCSRWTPAAALHRRLADLCTTGRLGESLCSFNCGGFSGFRRCVRGQLITRSIRPRVHQHLVLTSVLKSGDEWASGPLWILVWSLARSSHPLVTVTVTLGTSCCRVLETGSNLQQRRF